jgi:hypothetical protein
VEVALGVLASILFFAFLVVIPKRSEEPAVSRFLPIWLQALCVGLTDPRF